MNSGKKDTRTFAPPRLRDSLTEPGGDAAHHVDVATSHVVKRLRPDQAGALKLARRFGQALVCVRYRHDERRTHRYTTVELVVAQGPIQRSRRDCEIVAVFIDFDDTPTQAAARAHAARWDGRACVWRMPRHVARRLKLLDRIRELPAGKSARD